MLIINSLLLGRIACTLYMRCRLLLQMSYVAWCVCLSVRLCVGHTISCAKTAEPIELLFEGWLMWIQEPCSKWGPDSLLTEGALLRGNMPADGNVLTTCEYARMLWCACGGQCICCREGSLPRVTRRCGHLPNDFGHLFTKRTQCIFFDIRVGNSCIICKALHVLHLSSALCVHARNEVRLFMTSFYFILSVHRWGISIFQLYRERPS